MLWEFIVRLSETAYTGNCNLQVAQFDMLKSTLGNFFYISLCSHTKLWIWSIPRCSVLGRQGAPFFCTPYFSICSPKISFFLYWVSRKVSPCFLKITGKFACCTTDFIPLSPDINSWSNVHYYMPYFTNTGIAVLGMKRVRILLNTTYMLNMFYAHIPTV